jgi:hypothetical protein
MGYHAPWAEKDLLRESFCGGGNPLTMVSSQIKLPPE